MFGAEKISNAELEVMKLLWEADGPLSFSEVRAGLRTRKGWEKSTVNTLLRRLVEKKALLVEKRGVAFYSPAISEAEYRQSAEQDLIDRLYQGSAKNLVAALCSRGELTESDIDELKAYFQMGGGKT